MRCIYFTLPHQIYDEPLYLYLTGTPEASSLKRRRKYEEVSNENEIRLNDDSSHQLEYGHPASL